MAEPILVSVPYDRIDSNPYQHPSARRFQGEKFNALVEDIRINGVHQPPPARRHPDNPDRVQLQMGHRRLAACKLAFPERNFFNVVLKEVSDLEMFEGCVEENFHREDLNDIERAGLVEEYKKLKPDATNADMARVFGLKDPASITNIRKLLRLPEAIQKHVAESAIPDAVARQLVGIAAINAKAAQKIADAVAQAPKSEKVAAFEDLARNQFWNQTTNLNGAGWSADWLAEAPVTVERDLGEGDHLVGACAGCVYFIQSQGVRCARPACAEEKFKLWAVEEIRRITDQVKVPAAGPQETTFAIFNGQYHDDDQAKQLLNARKEIRGLLRLAPHDRRQNNYLSRLLGSESVTLVTTDKAAILAYFAELRARSSSGPAKAARNEKPAEETDAQREKRIAAEKKEQAENRAQRATMWKSKYDALWLVENAARLAGPQLRVGGDFLKTVEALFEKEYRMNSELSLAVQGPLLQAIKAETSPDKADALRREHLALCVFGGYGIADSSGRPNYTSARAHIVREAGFVPAGKGRWGGTEIAHGLGITLPDGWDVPPVHKTEFNCWHCGQFAGNVQEKLTQRDLADGWLVEESGEVFCSGAHCNAYHGKKLEKGLADAKAKKARTAAKVTVTAKKKTPRG